MAASPYKRDRPTIGVLAGWSSHQGPTSDHYRASLMTGIHDAARSRGCHLLMTWGIRQIMEISRLYPSWPEVAPESDFVPVGPWNTDGLIVFSPLGNPDRSAYIQQLIADGIPVLFVASGEAGPKISANNAMGVKQAIAHLAEHGHTRIAFLSGTPSDLGDSLVRLVAYRAALQELGLEQDETLIIPAWHDFSRGQQAMADLIRNGVKFTAVMASNDNSAIGAMRAIREAGLKIPQDVAVVGFDDQPSALAQVPPLTSVHVPLRLIGEQALLLMADRLTNGTPLESVQIPTRLIARLSCGCIPDAISAAIQGAPGQKAGVLRRPARAGSPSAEAQLVDEMLGALPSELRFPAGAQLRHICGSIVAAFHESLKLEDPAHFQAAFLEAVHQMEATNSSIDYWQEMITVMRREMIRLPVHWGAGETRLFAEDMLHQARAIVGESTRRQDQRHQYQRGLDTGRVNAATARLSVALTNTQIVEFLKSQLADIGIRHARAIFFEAEGDDPVAWSVVPGTEPDSQETRFRSREFPPEALFPSAEPRDLVLLPLVFQNEALGYATFEASDPATCEVIAKQLAATIKVSRLHAQVVELSLTDTLTGLHNRRYLDIFFNNEVARSRRYEHQLSVITADIDHFKSYNDEYGHPAGDVALQEVARCLAHDRRTGDLVARTGGEEFTVVLPETDIAGALHVAEKLRHAVECLTGLRRKITISLGVSQLNREIPDPLILLQQADHALYQAKRAGRNRVQAFQES